MGLLNTLAGSGLAPYGLRHDGAGAKGKGYFGLLSTPEGSFATEISASDDNGEFPLVVPTLTKQELQLLLSGDAVPDEIYEKALSWANMRRSKGKSPFAQPGELRFTPQDGGILKFR